MGKTLEEFAKAFSRNPDGSWTCITPATLLDESKPRIQVTPGRTFFRGTRFMNVDVAAWLDEHALVWAARTRIAVGVGGRN